MSPQSFLDSLRTQNIFLWLKGKDTLGTKGILTESIRTKIRESKEELVYHLQQQESLWQRSFQALLTMLKPICFQEDRWVEIKNWAYILFDEKYPYLKDLVKYDWPLVDIFGCRSVNPQEGHLQMGFLMIMTSPYDERSKGFTVQEVLKDWIVLSHPNKRDRFYLKDTINAFNHNKITLMEL